jgi:hypothetical protein
MKTTASVSPSVRLHTCNSRRADSHKIGCYGVLLKSVDMFRFRLKSDKNSMKIHTFMRAEMTGWGILIYFLFNDVVGISDYTATNDGMSDE